MTKNQKRILAYQAFINALKQGIFFRNKGDQGRTEEEINQVLGKNEFFTKC